MKKVITYDRSAREWKAELDGEFIGYFKSAHTAENELNRLAYERVKRASYVAGLEELRGAA